jgi:hypothetical protein
MGEESMINALRQLRQHGPKNKTARLRALFAEIEALKSEGFSHSQIVKTMSEHQLQFDLKVFEVTFYRIKKERQGNAIPIAVNERIIKPTMTGEHKATPSKAEKPAASPAANPLRSLSGTQRNGDFNHIPKAKFEVDNS